MEMEAPCLIGLKNTDLWIAQSVGVRFCPVASLSSLHKVFVDSLPLRQVLKLHKDANPFPVLLTSLWLVSLLLTPAPVPLASSGTISEDLSPPSHQARREVRFLELQKVASSSGNKYVLSLLGWGLHIQSSNASMLEVKLLGSPLHY